MYSKCIPETAATSGREAGRSESGSNQRVGDKQAAGAGAAKPAAERAERPLQSTVRVATEPYSYSGEQELCGKYL